MRAHAVNEIAGKNSPGRPRSESADKAILRAALEVFIERGIDGASVEEIAEKAGVARTTLYRRWPSKDELIARAIAEIRGNPEQRAISARIPLKRLPQVIADALAEMFARPEFRKIAARLIGSVPNSPCLIEIYWNNYLLPRRKIIIALLKQARSKRVIRTDTDPELLMDLISGAVIQQVLLRPGRRSAEEMRTYLLSVLRELGLAADRRSKTP